VFQYFTKEVLSGSMVSSFRYQNIADLSILIDSPPQTGAFAPDRDE
jgi:hypothetical protein